MSRFQIVTSEGNLKINSYVRANMIFTAAINQIMRKMCKVNDKKYSAVVQIINRMINKRS